MKERRKLYRNDSEDSGKARLSEINEELKNLGKEEHTGENPGTGQSRKAWKEIENLYGEPVCKNPDVYKRQDPGFLWRT